MKSFLQLYLLLAWPLLEASAGSAPDPAPTPPLAPQAQPAHRLTRTFNLPGGMSIEMVWIPPGSFAMGSPESEMGRWDDEGPPHQVTISRGFWLGQYEVTQGQWEAVVGTNPSHYKGNNRPVETVSWEDAQGFAKQLNGWAGNSVYRLPTEAEWEYAARAGTTTRWSFGDEAGRLGYYAWYSDNNSPLGTREVGLKNPNPWGLYDMHGNVWEWCQDWKGAYSTTRQINPTGPMAGSVRVLRGGFFNDRARGVRSAARHCYAPGYRGYGFGLRLLRAE